MEYGYDQSLLIRPEDDDDDDQCKSACHPGSETRVPILTFAAYDRSDLLPVRQLQRRSAPNLAACQRAARAAGRGVLELCCRWHHDYVL